MSNESRFSKPTKEIDGKRYMAIQDGIGLTHTSVNFESDGTVSDAHGTVNHEILLNPSEKNLAAGKKAAMDDYYG